MIKQLEQLNEREKKSVLTAGLCLAAYLFYALLFHPLHERVDKLKRQWVLKTQTLAFLKDIPQAKRSTQKKEQLNNAQLLSLITKQLKNNKQLQVPYELQQNTSTDIQIHFESVPFNALITWLFSLSQGYVIQIKQFDASKVNAAGEVKAQLILSAQ